MNSKPPTRPSLLPKEFDDIDAGWGEEHPTVPRRASRTAPPPPVVPVLELDEEHDRPTSIPIEAPEAFAKRVMKEQQGDELVFHGEAPTAPGFDEEFFERPTAVGARGIRPDHPSQVPTAPPPADFTHQERVRTVPRSPTLDNLFALADQADTKPAETPSLVERLRRSVTPIRRIEEGDSGQPPTKRPAREVRPAVDPALSPARDMKDRFALGDFSGALAIAEKVLATSPGDVDAKAMAVKCREVLIDMLSSRIGDTSLPVRVLMTPDQIRWLSLDHRSGFLLSMVDGHSTVEEILDISSMPRLDALRILVNLIEQRVVGIGR